MKTIVRYLMPEEAQIARIALEDEGIASYMEGAATVGMCWHWENAVGGVKLQVAEADAERAVAILAKKLPSTSEDASEEGVCPKCGVALPLGFCVCWSCGATMDNGEPSDASAAELPELVAASTTAPAVVDDEVDDATAITDAMAWRAFAASIIGLVFLPGVLHLYSVWTLLKLGFRDHPLGRKGKWYFGGAICIDVIVLGFLGLLLRRL